MIDVKIVLNSTSLGPGPDTCNWSPIFSVPSILVLPHRHRVEKPCLFDTIGKVRIVDKTQDRLGQTNNDIPRGRRRTHRDVH